MNQILKVRKLGTFFLLCASFCGLNANAQGAEPIRYKCSSDHAELVFEMGGDYQPGTYPDAKGVSFTLGGVAKQMSTEEAKPHVAGFGTILIFIEDRSGIQFTAGAFPGVGVGGSEKEIPFALETPFGDHPGSYTTIETGTCEVLTNPTSIPRLSQTSKNLVQGSGSNFQYISDGGDCAHTDESATDAKAEEDAAADAARQCGAKAVRTSDFVFQRQCKYRSSFYTVQVQASFECTKP